MKPIIISYRNPEIITPANRVKPKAVLFKMWVGSKYFIYKSMDVKALMKNLQLQLAKEIEVPKLDSIFRKLTDHCRSSKTFEISIEAIKGYSEVFNLLCDEYDQLQAAKKDKKCLNTTFVNHQHYPRWVSQEDINNFKIYYTKGKNVGSSAKDKRLTKFLNTWCEKELAEKIYIYVKKNYK